MPSDEGLSECHSDRGRSFRTVLQYRADAVAIVNSGIAMSAATKSHGLLGGVDVRGASPAPLVHGTADIA